MLQVATGRFFAEPSADRPIREAEFDDVAYSNVSFMNPVGRPGMWLRPGRRPRGGVCQYAVRLTGRYQPRGPGDILVQPFPLEAFEQFHLLAGVWFDAIFHNHRGVVERLCLTGQSDRQSSASLLGNLVATDRLVPTDRLNGFADFLDSVTALPRGDFRRLMFCLRGYRDAVEGVTTNVSLAYSTLVYVLEALSQGAESYEPRWEDYSEERRDALDAVLRDVASYDAARVRSALLKDRQFKLMKRFVDFVTGHLADSFFIEEAANRRPALGRGDLPRVLETLYTARSKVVHELRPASANVLHNLGGPAADVTDDGTAVHLTFPGLLRLTRHVLLEFVRRRPKEDPHPNDEWYRDIPGIVQGRISSEYWALNAETLGPAGATARYCAAVSLILRAVRGDLPGAVPHLRALATRAAALLPQAPKQHKADLLRLVLLIWMVTPTDDRDGAWDRALSKNDSLLDGRSVLDDCNAVIGDVSGESVRAAENLRIYWRRKGRRTAPDLAAEVEVALRCRLANLHLAEGDAVAFGEQARLARLEAAGMPEVQTVIADAVEAGGPIDIHSVLRLPERTAGEAEMPSEEDGPPADEPDGGSE